MTDDELTDKFNALSADILSEVKQKEIKEAIYNFEKFGNVKDFMKILRVDKGV